MKREKARLEELRAMSYEQYLQTPEWREVEKAALKRADNRCQVCRAAGVALRVHHASIDNLGCEQEADVLVLCDGCYDSLAQKMRQAIQKTADQADESGEEEPSVPTATLGQRALVFAPTAIGLDALMFLLHAPPPAEIGGLVAALVLAAKFPSIYASIRAGLPEPLQILLDGQAERRRARAARGEWSTWDKLMGRHLDEQSGAPHEDRGAEPEKQTEDEEEQEEAAAFETHVKMGKVLVPAGHAGERFDPHINSILGLGMVIAGAPGAGKSNLLGLLATGAVKCGMGGVIIDFKNEYYPLLKKVPCGVIAGHPSYAREAGENFFSLTPETARDLAEIIMTWSPYGFLAVVNAPSYGGAPDLLGETIAALFDAMVDWSMAQKEGDRLPCITFVDEAHNYFPEARKLSAYPMQAETFQVLCSAYNRMATAGRSFGHTLVVATQRIANIATWSIGTLQIKVIMKHTELNDLKRCNSETSAAEPTVVRELEQGTGIVVGLSKKPLIIQFDRQPARHVSHTPGIERGAAIRAAQPAQPRISRVLASQSERSAPRTPAPASVPSSRPVQEAFDEQDEEEQQQDEGRTQIHSYHKRGPEQSHMARARERERRLRGSSPQHSRNAPVLLEEAERKQAGSTPMAASRRPQLYEVPRQSAEEERWRLVPASDVAKGFALWQAGHSSVRKLEDGADLAGYGWSNGYCRDVIEAMEKHGLIQVQRKKKEASAL